MIKTVITATLILLSVTLGNCSNKELSDLRCEGLENPLGIDNTNPHFSWKNTTKKSFTQTAYEIEVASSQDLLKKGKADIWKSGKINSSESVMVPYKGKQLNPRQLCYWRVKTYQDENSSGWSDVQRFCVGIIVNEQMKGDYIGMGLGEQTAVLLNKDFDVTDLKSTALLHVNSLGYHEVYINGKKISDAVLAPAVSQLNKRSLIVTYDVSSFLRKGSNSIVLWISSGWYKKSTFQASYNGPAVRADLDLYVNGECKNILKTDATWKGCESGYYDTGTWRPGQFGGERIKASEVITDFSTAGLSKKTWKNVETAHIDSIIATPQMCQNNIVKEIITAVKLDSVALNTWRVDFGKVMNGFIDLHLPTLPEGQEVRATYGDNLDNNGKMSQTSGDDYFIASGNPAGDSFTGRFNHHCFRYVVLSNLSSMPNIKELKARRIALNTQTTGTFESSDADLNAIHDMITYTMSGLAFSGYMVDCAHIERLGYGGDGNASTLSLQNHFDVAPMYQNWLQAWNDVIRPDGSLTHTAPQPYSAGGGPYWCTFIIQAPWRTWMNFGDDRMLTRCYENMKLWLKYVDAYSKDGLLQQWPNTDYRNWYLGDWLAPKGIDVTNKESVTLINNCALSQSYNELIQIAEHLNQPEDKAEFTSRRQELNQRIHEQFFHADENRYGTGSQLDMVYPMLVGAVPDNLVESVEETLKLRTDTAYHNHLSVGLVGVPVITEWATLTNNVDFMYTMLKQPDYPGYLYMIKNGATGTWEDWDNPRSHFHNCYNGIDSWFIQALGGIIPLEPGYRKTLISPQIPKGLEWVTVKRETPYGTIIVHWQQTDGKADVHVELPNGITAIVNNQETTERTMDYFINIGK